jgi:hypothetical protein
MSTAHKIKVGQVWRRTENDETFLVTRLYTEALTTFAILRPTGAANSSMLRVKVETSKAGQTLPGFALAQGLD